MATHKFLSSRVQEIRPSGIRKIFDLACQFPDGLDLSIGNPDFDVPAPIKDEAIFQIKNGFNQYVSTRGIDELRQVIIKHLESRKINFEDILITAGTTGALYLAMLAIISPGDEVLMADPYFVAYANVIIMCGGIPKIINTYPDFRLREDAILPLITSKTKAILINNPGNPTGFVYSVEELKLVAEIADKHGLHVVSDEVYDRFVYSDFPFVSMGNIAADAVVMSGFSKSTGMTGWRLGYVSGTREIIDAMATFQQYSYVCANSVSQKAAVLAFDIDMSEYVVKYKARRDFIYDALKDQFNIIKPEGAFYIFPEAPGGDAEAFVNKAIEQKVFIIPGNVFSEKNTHFRISYAVSDAKLEKAVDVLKKIAS